MTDQDIMVKNMPLKVGQTLTFTGVPTSERCIVNICSGDDLALHISVRFKRERVVCNSRKGVHWGDEVHQEGFRFKLNKLLKISVCLTCEEFVVVLNDACKIHFPNRLGACEYRDFTFNDGVVVRSFEIN